jgi:hypothetical protein
MNKKNQKKIKKIIFSKKIQKFTKKLIFSKKIKNLQKKLYFPLLCIIYLYYIHIFLKIIHKF